MTGPKSPGVRCAGPDLGSVMVGREERRDDIGRGG